MPDTTHATKPYLTPHQINEIDEAVMLSLVPFELMVYAKRPGTGRCSMINAIETQTNRPNSQNTDCLRWFARRPATANAGITRAAQIYIMYSLARMSFEHPKWTPK